MDMYDCENHCSFNCRKCGKDYLMPHGGYDTNYCSWICLEQHVDKAESAVCEDCGHPKAAHMQGILKCWIGKKCPCTGFKYKCQG